MYKSTLAAGLLSSFVAAQSNLTTVLQSQSDLSTLTRLISSVPNLASTLSNAANPWTILAPTNDAFTTLLNGNSSTAMAAKMNNTAAIAALLEYHVLNGSYPSSALNTTPIFVPTYYKPSSLTTGQHVGAQKNDTAAQFLSGELQLSGSTAVNISAGGPGQGFYIHKVNSVLTLPKNATDTLLDLSGPQGNFSALAGAVTRTNTANTLNSARDLTLFVPNNAAFRAISNLTSAATVDTLRSIISYHAIVGSVLFSNEVTDTSVKTLQGNNVTLRKEGTNVLVNNAKVILPNIILANGVAHVIDEVLNPSNTATDRQPSTTPMPEFPNAGPNGDGSDPLTTAAPKPSNTVSIPSAATMSSSSAAAVQAFATPAAGMGGMVGAAAAVAGAAFLL